MNPLLSFLTRGVSFVFLIVSIFIFTFSINAQRIAVQDFEAVPATPTWNITAGAANISSDPGATDTPANQRIRGGSRSWQVNNPPTPVTLQLAPVSVAGQTNVRVTLHLSSPSSNANQGVDVTDTLKVFVALDGAAFSATPDITVTGGTTDARWGYSDATNAITTAGTPITRQGTGGTNQGTIYSTLIINIPDGTSTVALQVIAENQQGNEFWILDDVGIARNVTTAASVNVGGRVTDAFGRGISKARVSATNENGETSTIYTNPFGYYNFSGVPAGQNYIFSVSKKDYDFLFPTQTFFVGYDRTDLNFIAMPNGLINTRFIGSMKEK